MARPLRKYREKSDKSSARARFLEIPRDINCIPAGVYRLRRQYKEAIEFTVGLKVKFMLLQPDEMYIREVSREEARKKAIHREEFLDRYYQLRDEERRRPWKQLSCFKQLMTKCYVHHSIARDIH